MQSARNGKSGAGGWAKQSLILFLFGAAGLSLFLRNLGLGQALLKFVHPPGGVHKFLVAGIERMTGIANANQNGFTGGFGFNHVAAGTTDFGFHVFRMDISSHI